MTSPYVPALPKVLLITKRLESGPTGGRALLCSLNVDILKSIYAERLIILELSSDKLSTITAYTNAFRGHIDGLNDDTINCALQSVRESNVGKVFVDGSNLGEIVRQLKCRLPHVETTVFFHNCEARFFWGSLRTQVSVRALAVLVANLLAEKKAVLHSDKRVCLSARDSRVLRKLYGLGATHISPIALEDKRPEIPASLSREFPDTFALFVGSAFYGNQSGITWFIRDVVPNISMPVCIVGRGFDALRAKLEVPGKVIVIGEVGNLAECYQRAKFVIAPVLDGSGMKTKVAEALMFGKKVVGSPEAFSGYESMIEHIGWMCHDAAEFAAAVEKARCEHMKSFDVDLQKIFLQNYSQAAAQKRLHDIMES